MLPGFREDTVNTEILIMLVNYVPRIVTQSFSSHVVSGSSVHCFDGDSLMMATTSSIVTHWKTHRLMAVSLTTKDGSLACDVAIRISPFCRHNNDKSLPRILARLSFSSYSGEN